MGKHFTLFQMETWYGTAKTFWISKKENILKEILLDLSTGGTKPGHKQTIQSREKLIDLIYHQQKHKICPKPSKIKFKNCKLNWLKLERKEINCFNKLRRRTDKLIKISMETSSLTAIKAYKNIYHKRYSTAYVKYFMAIGFRQFPLNRILSNWPKGTIFKWNNSKFHPWKNS